MKTPQMINQMRPMPDGLAVEAVETLKMNVDTPKIVPVMVEDADARIVDLVVENSQGIPCSVYMVLVPDASAIPEPEPVDNVRSVIKQRKMANIEKLYRMGYSVAGIGRIYGCSGAAISLYMSRNGRPLTNVEKAPLILEPVTEPDHQLILG
ncbi:hypothetical protein ACRTDR_07410 [Shewanella algae]